MLLPQYICSHSAVVLPVTVFADDETNGGEGTGETLEDIARDEREYVRERLRRELDRDPTEDEINDWLRKHTEGY